MKSYTIKSNRNIQIRSLLAFKGESQQIVYDARPWAVDNGTPTSETVEVLLGDAGISSESLGNGASFTVSTPNAGASLIRVTMVSPTNTLVTHLRVVAKDPSLAHNSYDYC